MSVEERMQLIRLSEKLAENKEYAKKIGVSVDTQKTDSKKKSKIKDRT